MRAVVFGYHNIGHGCLATVLDQGHDVVAVVTHRDDPDEEVWFASVADLARSRGVPVATPSDPNTPEFRDWVASLGPDMIFSFYYRHMLKRPLLETAQSGALNLHGSYLPKYRGRCPVNWVLVNGETETGVTLHHMVEAPDAGDIVAQRRVRVEADDTALTLHARMAEAAVSLFAETLPSLADGTAPRIPQDHSQATYYGGRGPGDGRFDWTWSAARIHNLVRAVTHPYPGAFTDTDRGRLLVWGCEPTDPLAGASAPPGTVVGLRPSGPVVATGDGALLLTALQKQGGREIDGSTFAKVYSNTTRRPFTL